MSYIKNNILIIISHCLAFFVVYSIVWLIIYPNGAISALLGNNNISLALTRLGYFAAGCLLVIQIVISNKRAVASENSAKAALGNNIEKRYNNAVSHLSGKEPFQRIGAIYNLYHISQSTDTYDRTIFDMFCEYLKKDTNNAALKEKQIIIKKLFTVAEDKRVLRKPERIDLIKAELKGIDLTEANLTEANLTEANLTKANLTKANLTKANLTEANLTKANLTKANLTEANLTEATIPYNWDGWKKIGILKGLKLDSLILGSGTSMTNLDLTGASFKNTKMRYINLTEANLTGANLTGADLTEANLTGANLTGANLTGANLTGAKLVFEQLIQTKCLYGAKGLESKISKKLKYEKLKLFNKLEQRGNK